MSGLAKLLAQKGYSVSGSDLKPAAALDALRDLGVDTWVGHRPEEARRWDLVVSSSAVPASDPELVAAEVAGIPSWKRPRLLGVLSRETPALGFAGTHGKTTSTAMAVAGLRGLGRDPSFLVGGDLVDLNTNAHLGEPGLFVVEADEAFGTFLELRLAALMVSNVEADHLDHYGSVGALEEAFAEVGGGVEGPVVVCIDDPGGRRLANRIGAVTYGISPEADWTIEIAEHGPSQARFTLRGRGEAADVEVPRPGLHVVQNAAGVLATLAEVGHDLGATAAGLKDFMGVRRRFEVRARIAGVTVVDDYAHHPTEVEATLAAARLGPWHTIWAVFQPHRYSRTAELASAFGPALARADRVVVTDVYGAGEAPVPGITGRLVADAVTAAGTPRVVYVPKRRELASYLSRRTEEGDLVVLLGAGDVTAVADELAALLAERR